MMQIAYDPTMHVLCALAAGVRTSVENERLIAAIDELDRHGVVHTHSVALILELMPGTEPPDAFWRRRFAVQRQAMRAPCVFTSIVTTSKVLRGVLTAINWISPAPAHVKSVHHATVDEAAAWIEIVQGCASDKVRALFSQIGAPPGKAATKAW